MSKLAAVKGRLMAKLAKAKTGENQFAKESSMAAQKTNIFSTSGRKHGLEDFIN